MLIKKHGFTLVETIIVTAIISSLAAIILPNVNRVRINSNESNAQSTLRTIAVGLENYMTFTGKYPDSTDDLVNAVPPYVNNDYFSAPHNGYGFSTVNLSDFSYEIQAAPSTPQQGDHIFTITTGSVLTSD